MDSIEFVIIILSFAAILIWYLQNASAGSDGRRGMLSLRSSSGTANLAENRPSYRIKSRPARRAFEMHETARTVTPKKGLESLPRPDDDTARLRRAFRRQDEARYRVKDKALAFRPPNGSPLKRSLS